MGTMQEIDMVAFRATPVVHEPFEYLIVPGFIKRSVRESLNHDFPPIDKPGSFPISELSYGPTFAEFLTTLTSDAFAAAFEEKFGMPLMGRPTMVTVRGRCGLRDGNIHTDSVNKIITVLIYLNSHWEGTGGCLRLLRSGDNIDNVITEIPPLDGTLVAFRRSINSFHGHKPFVGPRRVIQLNWLTGQGVKTFETLRHRASAWLKRLHIWSGDRAA
jgi:SM-20-related protein